MQGDGGSYKITQIPPSRRWVCCTSQLTALKHGPVMAPVSTAVQTSSVTFSAKPWEVLMVCTPLKCGKRAGGRAWSLPEKKAGREEPIVSVF